MQLLKPAAVPAPVAWCRYALREAPERRLCALKRHVNPINDTLGVRFERLKRPPVLPFRLAAGPAKVEPAARHHLPRTSSLQGIAALALGLPREGQARGAAETGRAVQKHTPAKAARAREPRPHAAGKTRLALQTYDTPPVYYNALGLDLHAHAVDYASTLDPLNREAAPRRQ